jgi:hypothetical protein
MMNLAEYRRTASPGSPTSCPGPRWSAPGVVSTRTAVPAHGAFRGPDLDSARRRRAGRVAGRLNNACAVSARAGRSSSRRSASEAATYPDSFPDPASALVDAERKADFEEAARISSPLLPDLPLCRRPRTPPAPKPGSMRAASNRRRRSARDAARLHRPHRPRAGAARRLHARVPLAR